MVKLTKKFAKSSLLLFLPLAFLCALPLESDAQTKCSTVGAIKRFDFENATLRDIDVRSVTEDCKENPGKVLTRGEKVGGNSYIGTVFRVYERGSNRLINEFILEDSSSAFKVENCSKVGGVSFDVKIQNSMPRIVDIRRVNANCEENIVKTLKPGETFENSSNVNSVYRVYENKSERLIDEMVVGSNKGVFKVENCSKNGTPRTIYVRNGGGKAIEIRRVSEDCSEQTLASVTPGRMLENKSFADNVFRVYEKETGKFIEEFVVQPRVSTYLIQAARNDDPKKGFVETTNNFRAGINLPTFELDDTLTKACQWFAEFMAAEDKGYPVHNVSEIRKDKPYPNRNTSAKRLTYFGWDKKNTAHFEATILDTVPDIELLGSHFALAWSSSDTHDAPFFDKDRTKFNRVGFGFAKAKSGETKYYACAIFGKK